MRPLGLGPAESFRHGTRGRYVTGCRCRPCRDAIARVARERVVRAREAAAVLPPAAPVTVTRPWRYGFRTYRGCPGLNGGPCPTKSYLRKDVGPVCGRCRSQLVWDGLVDASRALNHIRQLSRQGIGYKAVAAAASVATSVVGRIRSGDRTRIRASTERRILAVDRAAVSDGSMVAAGPTWERIRWLLSEGFTRGAIAQRALGNKRAALQLRRRRIRAVTAMKIERFYRRYAA